MFRLTISVFLITLMASSGPRLAMAAPKPRYDTSVLEVRVIAKDRIEAYRSQRDFNYKVQKPEEMSLWEKIKWWFFNKIDELFSNKAVSTGMKWLLWLLTISVLAYAVTRIIGTDKVMLFVTGRKPPSLAFTTGDEDIHARDLDGEIASAEAADEYRRAIRLQYLRSLKMLAEKGRIEWSPSKTNIDYLSELRGGTLENDFRRITRIFEYAWYGEMEIDRDQYDRASSWFRDFNGILKT